MEDAGFLLSLKLMSLGLLDLNFEMIYTVYLESAKYEERPTDILTVFSHSTTHTGLLTEAKKVRRRKSDA